MALDAHIAELSERHRTLDRKIEEELARPTVDDLSYQTRRLTYSFTHDRHVLGFELGQELRRPSMSEKTDSLRATFRYRLTFGGAR